MNKFTLDQAITSPPENSVIYKMSSQLKTIDASEQAIFPIFKNKEYRFFVLKEYEYKFFDQIAEQDLKVDLVTGSTKEIFSSEWDLTTINSEDFNKYPWIVQRERTQATTGRPYDIVSKTGKAFHGNKSSDFSNINKCFRSKDLFIKINNQSAIHKHSIEVNFLGWSFSINEIRDEKR